MATRGRPKKIPTVEPTGLEERVAAVFARACGIPGCSAKNHLEEAREVIGIVSGGIKVQDLKYITKQGSDN